MLRNNFWFQLQKIDSAMLNSMCDSIDKHYNMFRLSLLFLLIFPAIANILVPVFQYHQGGIRMLDVVESHLCIILITKPIFCIGHWTFFLKIQENYQHLFEKRICRKFGVKKNFRIQTHIQRERKRDRKMKKKKKTQKLEQTNELWEVKKWTRVDFSDYFTIFTCKITFFYKY